MGYSGHPIYIIRSAYPISNMINSIYTLSRRRRGLTLQEEGGASWSYSQGEIEDLLQSRQPLPPQLQQLMDARLALVQPMLS